MLQRFYQKLGDFLLPKRVLILYGPRRVGKTTLVENYLKHCGLRWRLESGDDVTVQDVLSSSNFDRIKRFVANAELIAIDEAQRIPDVGMGLKILVDQHPHVKIIATGSSSFHLSRYVGEPLTGRKRTLTLFPLAQLELASQMDHYVLRQQLEETLIFGSYPDVILADSPEDKIEILRELVGSYIFRDILELESIMAPEIMLRLTKLLALQVGQLVSFAELATQLKVNQRTVARYIQLLEQSFVIYKLGSYSSNPRKEISKRAKYYFYDNGVLNGVIGHFNPISDRNDVGTLWENFIMIERIKKASYQRDFSQRYFWRSYDGQEVDLLEVTNGDIAGFEIKWSTRNHPKPPPQWLKSYPDASYTVINPDNYLDYLL